MHLFASQRYGKYLKTFVKSNKFMLLIVHCKRRTSIFQHDKTNTEDATEKMSLRIVIYILKICIYNFFCHPANDNTDYLKIHAVCE